MRGVERAPEQADAALLHARSWRHGRAGDDLVGDAACAARQWHRRADALTRCWYSGAPLDTPGTLDVSPPSRLGERPPSAPTRPTPERRTAPLCRLAHCRPPESNPAHERLTHNTMNDSIGLYLNDIGKVPLLTAEDERELSRVIEAGREAAEKLGQRQARRRPQGRRGAPPPTPRTGSSAPTCASSCQHRPPLPPPPGHGPARPHPGGQPRPRARRRQVRLAPRASSSPPTPRSGSARRSAGPSTRRPA